MFCQQAARERRPFLRRTKATAPPEVADSERPVETTTSKYRGTNRFKLRKTEKTNEKPRENETTTDKPSSTTAQIRNDRTRNFVRRRLGGANCKSGFCILKHWRNSSRTYTRILHLSRKYLCQLKLKFLTIFSQ